MAAQRKRNPWALPPREAGEAAGWRALDGRRRQLDDLRELYRAMAGGDPPTWIDDAMRVQRALLYIELHVAREVDLLKSDRHGAVVATELRERLQTWYHAHLSRRGSDREAANGG